MKKTKLHIVLTGPESCGKSYLSSEIAKFFNAKLIPEYSRIYYEKHPFTNTEKEITTIAKLQIEAESNYTESDYVLISDTGILSIIVWMQYYNYKIPTFIQNYWENAPYTHYLLCKPNIPWIKDELRNNEKDRDQIFNTFENMLKKYNRPYSIINAPLNDRSAQAFAIVKQLMDANVD